MTRPESIKVDRRWFGAPDRAWSPTVVLFLFATLGFAVTSAGVVGGVIPTFLGVALLAVCLYLGFTVLHDAVHGTAHRNAWVSGTIGRVSGLLLMVPFPLFRGVHLAHHSHTNDPDRDPDFLVSVGPAWSRLLSFLGVIFAYRVHFYRDQLWRGNAARKEALLCDMALVAFFVWAFTVGPGHWVLVLWVAPASITILWLAFAFDYLPHYPHSQQGRYYDTRVYPSRIGNVFLLGQNYHLIHHLWMTIPWYRYQAVFQEIEPQLRERGCPIGLMTPAVAPTQRSLRPSGSK